MRFSPKRLLNSGPPKPIPRKTGSFGLHLRRRADFCDLVNATRGPQVYFDSLAPEEQDRLAELRQDKTEDEVAEKHRSDVEAITGLQVLNRQNVSETEIVMDIISKVLAG